MYELITDIGIMIDYLRSIGIFTRVAQEGSFSKAAKSFGIAPSRVSESISRLENHVGATLFNRTTRKISLTSEGRLLFAHTSGILEGAERGLSELRETKLVPMGTLRISVPTYLLSSHIALAISRFIALHPKVHVSADFTDHEVDPEKEGYDLCIRSGQIRGNSSTTRKLGELERSIYVGKGYLAMQQKIDHPEELLGWDWINYRHRNRTYNLISDDGETIKLPISDQARLRVDSIDALYNFACMDLGVTVMPVEYSQRGRKEEKLVRIFDDWHLPTVKYFAVWPNNSYRKSLVSIFVDFLSEYLQNETQ